MPQAATEDAADAAPSMAAATSLITLRDYQQDAVDAAVTHFKKSQILL
jgi:superfamily II DNA or RNA helicase